VSNMCVADGIGIEEGIGVVALKDVVIMIAAE
jgi:hypothetical protein